MNLINILLLIISVFITHIIIMLFHELSHKKELNKNKIFNEIKWNLFGIKLFKNFAMAGCFFNEHKFNQLKYNKKKKILSAGIKTELFFIVLFLILFLISIKFYRKGFIFYYFSVTFLTLFGRVLLNYFGNGSDGEKLRNLNKDFRLSLSKRRDGREE